MTTITLGARRHKATIAGLLLATTLLATACGGSATANPTTAPAGATTAATSGATVKTTGGAATAAPQGSNPGSNLDCQAIANAAFDLNSSLPFIVTMTGSGGSNGNKLDSPFYVDTTKLRADLDVLAALPDPTDATEISMMGKPSEAIAQFRQLFDLIDKDANGQTTDPALTAFETQLIKMSTAINSAGGDACPNSSPDASQIQQPGAQPTPLTAGYTIGQTASVGDIRVTLDKVITVSDAPATQLQPGNRYLFAHITLENTGTSDFNVNPISSMYFQDATGKQYFGDPYSMGIDQSMESLTSQLVAGTKQSVSEGFQVPTDAGDLVWVFQDAKPNRAVFTVKVSDVAVVGTPITEPTEEALRTQAFATQTAFVDMMLGADATNEAAAAATPPEPVATDVPADTLDPTPAP